MSMAQTAERGLFDLMFSADALTGERYDRETLRARPTSLDRADVALDRRR
jgi:hypothetical protein